jgi:transposase
MAKLGRDERVTLKTLAAKGVSNREIARILGVRENTVRYHLRRMRENAIDGRSRQRSVAADYRPAIEAYLERAGEASPSNVAELHDHLVAEHGYPGSLRSLQRFVNRTYPQPQLRARRRVETPPGAQAQADWAHYPGVLIAGRRVDLIAFAMILSYSRADTLVWNDAKDQLAWLTSHNAAFTYFGGIPATVRIDNESTAVAHGAGAWGRLTNAYQRYARTVRFHVDLCPVRSPEAKGKVERRIRDQRSSVNPYRRHWDCLEELQAWSDESSRRRWERRTCPATGTSVLEAFERERPHLQPLQVLPEPFDACVSRRVAPDCTIQFESRTYSVPFVHVGQLVEVRGCVRTVQVLFDARIVATHVRRTPERIVLDPRHYEGPDTRGVRAPQPLGRMGRRLQEIADLKPEERPLDLYAALAEVAR